MDLHRPRRLSRCRRLLYLSLPEIWPAKACEVGAICPNGASLICLVEAVTDDRILARRVTTQDNVEFDRSSGAALGNDAPCTIDSIAPQPVEIHNIMLGLDRKMRLERDPEKFKLNREEIQAIHFVNSYYPANPL
jgi:hypothetical protein